MSPEQKQAAMQKLVDEATALKASWRNIDQQRAGAQASVDRCKAECDRLLAEAGVIEEMLKILEKTEAKDPSPPAEPPADEPGSTPPPAPKKK